jgi:hypothetical protein
MQRGYRVADPDNVLWRKLACPKSFGLALRGPSVHISDDGYNVLATAHSTSFPNIGGVAPPGSSLKHDQSIGNASRRDGVVVSWWFQRIAFMAEPLGIEQSSLQQINFLKVETSPTKRNHTLGSVGDI